MAKPKVESISPTTPIEYARAYARRGWQVLPIWPIKANGRCACNSDECIRPGKHPAVENGVKDASADLDQIEEWWNDNPRFGVAIATGEVSGITGLDIDIKEGKAGDLALDKLRGKEAMPAALAVQTPSGGLHYYFAFTKVVKTAAEPFGKGTAIDTRNDNGYLIAPPSAHIAGGKYKWLSNGWQKLELPEWPDWLCKSDGDDAKAGDDKPSKSSREKFDPRNEKSVAALRHALQFVDYADYDRWLKVGFILGRAFRWSDEGYAIYSEWSAQAGADFNHKKSHGLYYKDSRKAPTKSLTTATIHQWALENDAYTPLPTEVERTHTIIDDRTDVPAIADKLAEITGESDAIYKRNGDLVFLAQPQLSIIRHTPKTLQLELTRLVNYFVPGEKGLKVGPVPEVMAAMVLERKACNARGLLGISRFPVFRKDWSICATTGYDPETGMYIDLPTQIKIVPTGVSTLRELVSDFPWATPVDESVFFAALFTVGLRHLFPTAPIFGFSAYAPGSGKSLLCDVINMIWYGRRASKSFWPEKEEEMGKTIVANLIGGGNVLVFDNIDRGEKVHDATLCAMLTSDSVKMRLLGKSEVIELDTHVTVMATGNDLTFTGDTARRALLCTIDVPSDAPERRTGFKHDDILGYIEAHREGLLGCAVGAILAWVKDGAKPGQYVKGSFEQWGKVISGILQKNGLPHLTEYSATAKGQIDESADAEADFISLLSQTLYVEPDAEYTTIEVAQKVSSNSELRDGFKALYPLIVFGDSRKNRQAPVSLEINVTSVGKLLTTLNGRWRSINTYEKTSKTKPLNSPPNSPPNPPPNPPPVVSTPSTVMRVVYDQNKKTKQKRWKIEERNF